MQHADERTRRAKALTKHDSGIVTDSRGHSHGERYNPDQAVCAFTRSGGTGAHESQREKSTVSAFYDLMFNQCQPAEAVRRYVGATYTQHNPMVGTQGA